MSQHQATAAEPAAPSSRMDRLTLILVVLAAASTLTAVSSTYVNAVARQLASRPAAPDAPSKEAAYHKAVQFLKERQTQLTSVSDFNQSTVEANGSQFKVSLSGNQTAADGAMMNSFYVVELSFDGQTWELLRLRQ